MKSVWFLIGFLCLLIVLASFIFVFIRFDLSYNDYENDEYLEGLNNPNNSKSLRFVHHNNDQLKSILKNFNLLYPNLSRLYSIGRSVLGREILVLEISDNPGKHEPGEAEIKLIGNIHGNEVVGRELLLHLIEHLLTTYHTNLTTQNLVNNLRIHICPTVNPDGYEDSDEGDCYGTKGRSNAHNIDLNRNFPDRLDPVPVNFSDLEPETQNIMKWSKQFPFVLSASLHGGALVVNYPYDNNEKNVVKESPSPDDDVFRYLSLIYSYSHPQMYKGRGCADRCDAFSNEKFLNGITNGAQWYSVNGGMQDWNYINTNCFELTIELGCMKFPMEESLEGYWNDNREPLIKLMDSTYTGINGFVFDQDGNPIEGVIIKVDGIDKNVTTYKTGDYWRLLAPKRHYNLTALKTGFVPKRFLNVFVDEKSQLNFTLTLDSNFDF